MGVSVEFVDWGPVYLAPGEEELRWFTVSGWFDPVRWSAMHANPRGVPQGPRHDPREWLASSVQIVEQWTERTRDHVTVHWCRVRNRGATGALYHPQALIAPL